MQIRRFHYMVWAMPLRKKEIGIMIEKSHPQYSFPTTVLKLIWATVTRNIKGETQTNSWQDTN